MELTCGALQRIVNGERVDNAVLQVLNHRSVSDLKSNSISRYRFMIHDGVSTHGHTMVIANHLIEKVNSGELEKFTVFRLTKYVTNTIDASNKTVLIIQDVEIIGHPDHRIGNPTPTEGVLTHAPIAQTPAPKLNTSDGNVSTFGKYNPPQQVRVKAEPNEHNMSAATGISRIKTENICRISDITPYFNAWVIRGRVTSKSPIRTWSNAKGEGTLFSFDVTDESSEIRITAFKKECEKFFDMIEIDKIYYISKGTVKTANKKFSNVNNDYELTLNQDTVIQPAEDSGTIPKLRYKFIEIKDLVNSNKGSFADIIGIVLSIDDVNTVVSKKTNKELKKRDIMIGDKSSSEIRFTLWDASAESFAANVNSVIAIKNAMVGDYNGKTLSSVNNTSIQIDPDIAEAHLLKGWYMREGQSVSFNALSKVTGDSSAQWKYLCQINTRVMTDQRTYSNIKGIITFVGRNPMYKSCVSGCFKKVQDDNNGLFHCDKCGKDAPTFEWRYLLSVGVCDASGETYATMFHENAEKLIGIPALELSQYNEYDRTKYEDILKSIQFKPYEFRIGSAVDVYNQQRRVKSIAYSVTPIDIIKQSRKLLRLISSWNY